MQARRSDPRLNDIIRYLRGDKLGDILSDPRKDSDKFRERARHHVLAKEDGMLRRIGLEGLDANDTAPVNPQVDYKGKAKLKNGPKILTWPALICGIARFTPHGAHQNPVQMLDSIWGLAF